MNRFLLVLFLSQLLFSCQNKDTDLSPLIEEHPISYDETDPYVMISDSVAHHIRFIIEHKEPERRYFIDHEELYSSVLLPEFYVSRNFLPLWYRTSDSLFIVNQMIDFISSVTYHGFSPEHYHITIIKEKQQALEEEGMNPLILAHLEMLLSDAFFMISSHLYNGKLNPENLTAEWAIRRNKPELQLDNKLILLSKSSNVFQFMETFYPPHPGYAKMVHHAQYLDSLKTLDFPVSIQLAKNARSIDLSEDSTYNDLLFKKLQFLGLADSNTTDQLHIGIRSMQRQYGLNEDGKIGRNTIAALNHTYEKKLISLYVNMERLRWLPDSLNKKHILVNIADYTLDYIVEGDTLISMKTVVGQQFRQTPIFNARMTYLVFSPTWTVPPGILRNDVVPAVSKNISYLSQKNMQVLDASGKVIDPTTIDWKKVRAGGKFPYRVRQTPGGHNALGRVKFMFPNKYSVYLHDTPSRELFQRDERIFSSGCIRIEKPFELAQLLLQNDERWNDETIQLAMQSGREQSVVLKQPIDVYIFYLTSWASEKEVFFRQDVYNRDAEIYRVLQEKKKS